MLLWFGMRRLALVAALAMILSTPWTTPAGANDSAPTARYAGEHVQVAAGTSNALFFFSDYANELELHVFLVSGTARPDLMHTRARLADGQSYSMIVDGDGDLGGDRFVFTRVGETVVAEGIAGHGKIGVRMPAVIGRLTN